MRLIDVDVLYDLIDGGFDIDFDETPETKRELLRMIKESPTIDAEPVIRCKNCEYYNGEDKYCVNDIFAKSNGYCMYGRGKR